MKIEQSIKETAQKKLIEYLAKSERTVFDCRNLLKKHDVPQDVVDALINEAVQNKWLSDERYARLFTEDSIYNAYSPADVKYRLSKKRIDPEIINITVEKIYDKDTLKKILNETINKLIKINREITPQKRFEKIATTLYRKGFEYSEYEHILKVKLGLKD